MDVDMEAALPPAPSRENPVETGPDGSGNATKVSATPTSLGFVEPGTETGRLTGTVWVGDQPGRANVNVGREDVAYGHYATVYDGTFSIENLLPGVWTVWVYSEECQGEVLKDTVEIAAGQMVERVYRFPQRRMVGVVLGSDGEPAVGVEVKARRTSGLEEKPWPTDFSARTNLNGEFVIDGIYKGEYTVTADDAMVEGVSVPEEGDSEEVLLRMGAKSGGLTTRTGADWRGLNENCARLSPVGSGDGEKPG